MLQQANYFTILHGSVTAQSRSDGICYFSFHCNSSA